ncbi:MAG: efflux RND transporter permease subunit [Acidobacteriota bacterium]
MSEIPKPSPGGIERYAERLLRLRWPVIVGTLILIAALGAGAPRLGFNDDYRFFFGPDNPQLQAFEELQAVYTKDDNILFTVEPPDGDVFTAGTLSAIEELTEAAWQIPFARRVDSVTNFQHTRADGDDLIVEDLVVDAAALDGGALAAAREVALAEPLLAGRLLGPGGRVTGVNVTLQMPGDSVDETERAVAAARELSARIEAEHPGHRVRMTGFAMLNNAFTEASKQDMSTLIPLMYAIIVIFLVVLFRSLSATLATLAVIALSTIAAMGAAGWMRLELTPPSAIAPTLILTLAVADSVHLLKGYLGRLALGDARREALVESLRVNLWPIFLTSASTAIGFLSMNFSDAPPFHDLGNITAFGVMVAFGLSVSFLPALMSLLPARARRSQRGRNADETWDRVAVWVLARRRSLLVGMSLLVVALALSVPRNELNETFVEYFAPSVPFRADTDFVIEEMTGIYQAEFSLGAASSGGVSDPEYLETLDRFAAWWRVQPGVLHVRTLADTMRRVNRSMHGDDPAWYRLPQSRELAAQYLLLYELSLPYGLDLTDQIDVDKSATRFTVTFGDLSSKEIIALAERGEDWLRENAPPSMFTHAAGPAMMFAHLAQRNIESMLVGTVLALLLISALLVVALRSWRYGLLSLVPNLAPAILAFGIWGLTVAQINIGLSMVMAMTLGIVVDDTVHFLSKYQRGRREHGLDADGAVRFAFRSVGSALWTTSLVLVAGFLVLSLSSFDLNAGMGRLTAITIALALFVDFTLLPALLATVDRRPTRAAAGLETSPATAG